MSRFPGIPMLAQYPQWARGPARVVGDEVVLDEDRVASYYLHNNDYELMFDFANLAADLDNLDERELLSFVRRYGLLRHGIEEVGTGNCRESLAEVWTEARWFAELLELYADLRDAVGAGSAEALRAKIDLRRFYGNEPVDDKTVMARAGIMLSEQVTQALAGCSHSVISSAIGRETFSSPDRFILGIQPPNLLSLIYVRFAYAMVDKVRLEDCPGCGRAFVPKSGKQRYCTPSCASTSRWRRWNERQANEIKD
jgi:hypothetical protein